jgi:hypothetical protein
MTLFILDRLIYKIENMVKLFVFHQNRFSKEFMKTVLKCQDAKEILMVSTLVSFLTDKDMEMENGFGTTVNFMKENGNLVLKVDKVSGNLQKAILMKANGFSTVNKVKEFIDTRAVLMKVSLSSL